MPRCFHSAGHARVSQIFDLIISVDIITQWTAHVCCATSQLVYYPVYWTKPRHNNPHHLPVLMKHPNIDIAEQLAKTTG